MYVCIIIINLHKHIHRYTKPQKENIKSLLHHIFGQMIDSISRSRNMTQDTLRQLVDKAPLTVCMHVCMYICIYMCMVRCSEATCR